MYCGRENCVDQGVLKLFSGIPYIRISLYHQYFFCNIRKMTMERLADSVDELYNAASSTVYLANIYGLCCIYFLKCILFYISIYVKAAYR